MRPSIGIMLEAQIAYVRQAIERLAAGARAIELRRDRQRAYRAEFEGRFGELVWSSG